jgi:hypothetical protein
MSSLLGQLHRARLVYIIWASHCCTLLSNNRPLNYFKNIFMYLFQCQI